MISGGCDRTKLEHKRASAQAVVAPRGRATKQRLSTLNNDGDFVGFRSRAEKMVYFQRRKGRGGGVVFRPRPEQKEIFAMEPAYYKRGISPSIANSPSTARSMMVGQVSGADRRACQFGNGVGAFTTNFIHSFQHRISTFFYYYGSFLPDFD